MTESTKSKKELLKELAKKRKDLHEFRFAVAGSKIRNVKEGKNTKKDIARILTALNNKEK